MKALLLPFSCEGYDNQTADVQVRRLAGMLDELGIEVIAAPRIDTADKAELASRLYHPFHYDFAVLMPVTWSEPRLAAIAARAFFGSPLAVFCISEFVCEGRRTEFSSVPAGAALAGSLRGMGVPCELFADFPETEEEKASWKAFAAAAHTLAWLRTARFGFFGHNFNGITAAGMDLGLLRRRFGTEVYSFDVSELLSRMEKADPSSPRYAAMQAEVLRKVKGSTGGYLDRIVRMSLALGEYAEEYGLAALDVRCHTELSQTYGLTACLPLSVLGDKLICSCEADLPVVLTQAVLSQLAGGTVSTYVDIRTLKNNVLSVGACGFAPCALTGGKAEVGGLGGGYLTNSSSLREGRVTLARLVKLPEGQLGLHLTGGTAASEKQRLWEYGCAPYPMAAIRLDCDIASFREKIGANHYALVYRELTEAAGYFCRFAGVEMI